MPLSIQPRRERESAVEALHWNFINHMEFSSIARAPLLTPAEAEQTEDTLMTWQVSHQVSDRSAFDMLVRTTYLVLLLCTVRHSSIPHPKRSHKHQML